MILNIHLTILQQKLNTLLKLITQDSETKTYYMVLQYANSGDLRCYLNDYFSKLDWSIKVRLAKEISSGIDCSHSANIVHRDL
ncbi:kinase-like protein [Gigaspora margarita]|uniref:Kinase-like protein n=1 Tax=Gigaspora margarita TaxID=4874 RepID=A0A8H4EL18_GIGMA|nr:kinase-like protein [Gigaspora margarita]